jgi:molybdenum cofactor synthesis domain-containing protein
MTSTDEVPAVVLTISDRSSTGARADRSGTLLATLLREAGYAVDAPVVVPDGRESVRDALHAAVADGARLVVTTGGTGVSPRDFTPEGTLDVVTREMHGVAEELRRHGSGYTPLACLSRGVVGVVDHADPGRTGTLVVNLPGSTRGVEQGMERLVPLLPHILEQIVGWDH